MEADTTREVQDTTAEKLAHEIAKLFDDGFTTPTFGQIEKIEILIHHQLQKARVEERERLIKTIKGALPFSSDLETYEYPKTYKGGFDAAWYLGRKQLYDVLDRHQSELTHPTN